MAGPKTADEPTGSAEGSDAAALSGLLARRFRGLAEEKRLRLLGQLSGGTCCVCELVERLDTGQSLLSFHLKALRESGLVAAQRRGRWVYYSLNRDAVAELRDFLTALETNQSGEPACC